MPRASSPQPTTVWSFEDELDSLTQPHTVAARTPAPGISTNSIVDIASLVYPELAEEGADFGPLASLVDAEMSSCVELSDTKGNTHIEYRADGLRDTVAKIAGEGSVAFDAEQIIATDGTYQLVGDAESLRFLGTKNLAGTIVYELVGPEVALEVVSDFGEGNAWPTTHWMCL